MKHFDYFAPTEIIFGAGRVTEAGALAARYGKKAMLVTVPSSLRWQNCTPRSKKACLTQVWPVCTMTA